MFFVQLVYRITANDSYRLIFLSLSLSLPPQTIQYITRSKIIETETRELSSVSRGKIKPTETDDWKNEKLFVPPLPPTNLRGCHIIRIQYDVFVSSKSTTLFNCTSATDGRKSCEILFFLYFTRRRFRCFRDVSRWGVITDCVCCAATRGVS